MKPHLTIIVLALTSTALAQGPLTPPPGADPSIGPVNALTAGGLPQATMKTLHQAEPRTPLAAGGWRLAAGGWRLAAGGWRLAAGEESQAFFA